MLEGFFNDWYKPECLIIEVLCALQVFTAFRRFYGPYYTHEQNQPERVREDGITPPFITTCLHLISMLTTEYKYYEKLTEKGRPELIPAVRNIHLMVIFVHALLLHMACLPSRERFIQLVGGIQAAMNTDPNWLRGVLAVVQNDPCRKVVAMACVPIAHLDTAFDALTQNLPRDLEPILRWFKNKNMGPRMPNGFRRTARFPLVEPSGQSDER
uniref:Uncharacterized protein n=1 Tax=Ditylenchus dipsaci TaxID=166011 RepID=A0A915CZ23_9BILA